MSANTKIEWTDRTWNVVTGCTKVSAGCKHCYAEGVAKRFWATQYPQLPVGTPGDLDVTNTFHRPRRFTDVMTHEDRLLEPLKWRKPQRVFVNSMSDLFHEAVPDEFIDRVFAVMFRAPRHTFQILTKRADRMRDHMSARRHGERYQWPLPNVHLGVSCENQETADERIPLLLQTPAAARFISAEPLLGHIDIRPYMPNELWNDLPSWKEPELDWVIVGGESGPGARPCDLAWVRSIVGQCQQADVACFVKQLGAVPIQDEQEWRAGDGEGRVHLLSARNHRRAPDGFVPIALGNRKGGDITEWPEDLRVREFPRVAVGSL